MKCLHCGRDSNYKERSNRTCPGCKRKFAFEPRAGDPVTDRGFQNAIDAVSAHGEMRWGVEHLYYEVCRQKRLSKFYFVGVAMLLFTVAVMLTLFAASGVPGFWLGVAVFIAGGVAALLYAQFAGVHVRINSKVFRGMYDRWCQVHGAPKSVIARQPQPPRLPRDLEPDVADYSFDRAVICDRSRTVDLLLANNFHFENNCAVLSIDGYPTSVFETVRTMLKRNPRLQVFALHDASPDGCRLAHRVANDPAWFGGKIRVVDVGLRPAHAGRFRGLLQRAGSSSVAAGDGISAAEAAWLTSHVLELAAIRPEQVLKRLFRAINARAIPTEATAGADVILIGGDVGGGVNVDGGALASDAGAIEADVDAFG